MNQHFILFIVIFAIFLQLNHSKNSFPNLSKILQDADAMPATSQAEIDSLISAMKVIVLHPLRPAYFQESCTSSHHCRFGTCNQLLKVCECDSGYSPMNCEYSTTQTEHFASVCSKLVSFIEANYPVSYIISTPAQQQLLRIFYIVRQAFKAPDAVAQSDVDKIQAILLSAMDKVDILTYIVPRFHLVEAVSLTVEAFYAKLKANRQNYAKGNIDQSTYTSKKSNLSSKMSILLSKMQQKVLPQIGASLTSAETTFKIRTNLFTAQIALTTTTKIVAETRSLKYNGPKFLKYEIQDKLFGNPVPVDLNLLEQIIEYNAHPDQIGTMQISSLSRYSLYKTDKSEMTLQKGSIIYKIPLNTPSILRDVDTMSCYKWDGKNEESCFTLSVTKSQIICSCRGSTKSLVYSKLKTNKYELVTAGLGGVYTDYDGYKYWFKSLGFLFTVSLAGLFLILQPVAYFLEKKKLRKIRDRIKVELQQLDNPGAREFDNQFKSVVALDHSQDSNFDNSYDENYMNKSGNKSLSQVAPIDNSMKKGQNSKIITDNAQEDKFRRAITIVDNKNDKNNKSSSKNLKPTKKAMKEAVLQSQPTVKNYDLDKILDDLQGKKNNPWEFDRSNEIRSFSFWNQLKGASPVLNLIFVDSILMPRHVRLTILFLQLLISIFVSAVYYSAITRPIIVQEEYFLLGQFEISYIWIAFFAPIFADLSMYFFAEIFRLSKSRFKNVQTVDDFQVMMQAYLINIPVLLFLNYRSQMNKEILLRYSMAYFIVASGVTAAVWYIVKFSSKHGQIIFIRCKKIIFRWQISTGMLYSSLIAWIIDLVVYELILTTFVFLMYKMSRKAGLCLDKVRKFKQATSQEDK